MPTLVLVRHGQSVWNAENLFTGWYDSDLSEQGEAEAREGGRLLAEAEVTVDVVHTSVQTRAIRTAELVLRELDRLWIPVRRHWRLNERHYGDLEGRNKKELAEKYGREQIQTWRRSYDVPPPPLPEGDARHPGHDPRYHDLPQEVLPCTECLKDVVARMLPYWYDAIVPDLRAGHRVFISAHGNSIRALVKHLKQISDDDIPQLEIPTGAPWLMELSPELRPVEDRFLGDPEQIRRKAEEVAHQAG
jgi:2,3-bisphosphoglycerate-dependent phosphoglycerate mutase